MLPLVPSEHQQRVNLFMSLAGQSLPAVPTEPSWETRILRSKLIIEESLETICKGMGVDVFISLKLNDGTELVIPVSEDTIKLSISRPFDMIEAVDGCHDVAVVTTGTLSALGVIDTPGQAEVDNNNLGKFGPGHYRREDGKLMKPPGHKPPNIRGVLEAQGWKEPEAIAFSKLD